MKKYPSVLHIIDSLEPGGAEKIAIILANLFQEKGHDVGLIYFNRTIINYCSQVLSDVELVRFDRKIKYNPIIPKSIKYIINKYDILHIHLRYNLKYYFFLNLFNRFNKPIYFHDHYGNIEKDYSANWFEKLLLRKTVYICVSDTLREWATRNGLKKIFFLQNIIVREKNIDISDSTGQLIMVGNIHKRKNQLFALRLLKRILKIKPMKIDIYGSIQDPDYFNILSDYIERNNLTDNVNFIFNCNNIQKVLQRYSLALHCATSETGPLVLMEYMAHGLPFISNDTGYVVNYLKQELDFLIMDSFSISSWIKTIDRIESKSKKELNRKLINIFEKNCSTDNYYKNCLEIYIKNLPLQ